MPRLDVEIDALTSSVIVSHTGKSLPTRIVSWRQLASNQRSFTRKWRFNWYDESRHRGRKIVALLVANSNAIEGLVSFELKSDHVHVHLLESAPYNVGGQKRYTGLPANLMAYVYRESDRLGFDGFVAFDSKTELIDHYQRMLGAVPVAKSNRMIVGDEAARRLIEQYFKDGDQWA